MNRKEMVEDLKANCKFHHSSLKRGYVSRKIGEMNTINPYSGKFGEGYTTETNNSKSNQYSYINYYIRG